MRSESNKQSLKSLELIQNELVHGDLTEIALKVGLSRQTVKNNLFGHIQNPDQRIIQAAIKHIQKRKKTRSKMEMSINKSLNS